MAYRYATDTTSFRLSGCSSNKADAVTGADAFNREHMGVYHSTNIIFYVCHDMIKIENTNLGNRNIQCIAMAIK